MDLPASPTTTSPRRLRLLFGALVLLALVAIAQTLVRRARRPEPPGLRGDHEEAAAALESQLERTHATDRLRLLLTYSADPSPGLRYAAVDALGHRQERAAADALVAAFADYASLVRQRAMEVLPTVDEARGFQMLLAGLRDEDVWIREAAVSQLLTLSQRRASKIDRRAIPLLIRALDDPVPTMPMLAAGALRHLTGKPWRYRLIDPAPRRAQALRQWRRWWAEARSTIPSDYANVRPITPARTDPAPQLDLKDLDGRPVRLGDRPGRLTLLNFWGTWCGPCRDEVAGLARLANEYGPRGLDVVGIAVSERGGTRGLRRWCEERGIGYRQTFATKRTLQAYGDIHEVPVSVLIDASGRIRRRWEGDRDYSTFRAGLERVLQEDARR